METLQYGVISEALKAFRVKVVWHRSRVIFSWNTEYIYNTVAAWFWIIKNGPKSEEAKRAYVDLKAQGWEPDPTKANAIRNLRLNWRVETFVVKTGRLYVVKMYDVAGEPTVLVITGGPALGHKTFINVVVTGSTDLARSEVERFFKALHKPVNFDDKLKEIRDIYEELYIRYNEKYEQRVAEIIGLLYRIFGDNLNDNRVKAYIGNFEDLDLDISEGYDIYKLRRAALWFNQRIDIKTYRPKEFSHPAKTPWDHPKAEVTIYYEHGNIKDKDRLRALAIDLLATVAFYAAGSDLDSFLVGESLPYDFSREVAGYGVPNERLLNALKARELGQLSELIMEKENVAFLLKNEKIRAIIEFLSQRSGSAKDIKFYLEKKGFKVAERTIQYYLKQLLDAGVILRWRRGVRGARKEPYVYKKVVKKKNGQVVEVDKVLYAQGGSSYIYMLNIGLLDDYINVDVRAEDLKPVPYDRVLKLGQKVKAGGRIYELNYNESGRLALYYVKRDGSLSDKWFKDVPAKVPIELNDVIALWSKVPVKIYKVEDRVYYVSFERTKGIKRGSAKGVYIELLADRVRFRVKPNGVDLLDLIRVLMVVV